MSAPRRRDASILGDLFGSLKGSGGIIQLLEALTRLHLPGRGAGADAADDRRAVLAGTQEPIGQAPGSYVTGNVPEPANPLFPAGGNPEWLPPDGASAYADLRLQDRGARVDEAEARASAGDGGRPGGARRGSTATCAQRDPGHDHRTDVQARAPRSAIESAGQLHKLTSSRPRRTSSRPTSSCRRTGQRKQADLYRARLDANGYWTGMRTLAARRSSAAAGH